MDGVGSVWKALDETLYVLEQLFWTQLDGSDKKIIVIAIKFFIVVLFAAVKNKTKQGSTTCLSTSRNNLQNETVDHIINMTPHDDSPFRFVRKGLLA